MATPISSTQLLGARLLKEIRNEEGPLEDVGLDVLKRWFLIDKD